MNHLSTPITAALLRGFIELDVTPTGVLIHRLPAAARAQCADPQLAMVEAQPSGVQLRFTTTATDIALDTRPTKRRYLGLPARPDGVYDLVIDGQLMRQGTAPGGNVLQIDMARGTVVQEPGPVLTLRFADLPIGNKRIEIWLPHDETTELVGLRSNAAIEPVAETGRPPLAASW